LEKTRLWSLGRRPEQEKQEGFHKLKGKSEPSPCARRNKPNGIDALKNSWRTIKTGGANRSREKKRKKAENKEKKEKLDWGEKNVKTHLHLVGKLNSGLFLRRP